MQYSTRTQNSTIIIEQAGQQVMLTLDDLKHIINQAEEAQSSDILADTPQVDGISWAKSKSPDRLGIESPYNPEFVRELKLVAPGARWNSTKRIWFFDAINKPEVYALAQKYFGSEQVTHRIEWDFKRTEDVQIDGKDLIAMSRDKWAWRVGFNVRVIEADLTSGGSRRRPDVTGRLVIELVARKDAQITPAPTSHEIIEAVQA